MKPRFKPVPFGFGGLDLLAVIAVAAMLGAVCLAAVGFAKQARLLSDCASQMKQLGIATQMWLHDFDDRFVWMVPANEGGSQGSALASEHFLRLSNYLQSPSVLACPGLRDHRPPARSWSKLAEKNVSYGIGTDARLIMPPQSQSISDTAILFSDMDLEGGSSAVCGRCKLTITSFDLPTQGSAITNGLRWSKTNHIDTGNMVSVDGTLLSVGNLGLRRQVSLQADSGESLHLLMPK